MRTHDVKLLQQIVNYLDNHQEAIRIKKMLYCLCINRWEKDVDYLSSINSEYLIEQILREYTTLSELKILLQKILQTVNKPKQYIQVAKVIYLAIGQLYPEFQKEHSSKTPPSVAQTPVTESTRSYSSQEVPSAFQRAYTPEATQAHTSLDVPSALQREVSKRDDSLVDKESKRVGMKRGYVGHGFVIVVSLPLTSPLSSLS